MLPSRAGEIAPSVSVSPFPASRQVLLPPHPPPAPRRRRRTSFRPVPAGAAGVIQPGRGGYPCRGSLAGGSPLPESAWNLRPVLAHKCEIGRHLTPPTPSSPWYLPVPTRQVFGPEPASGKAKTCPVLERCAFGFRLQNQESLTGVAAPLNCRFPPPSRGTVLAHREGWR